MLKVLHLIDDFERQYVSRKERRREPTSVEDSIDISIQRREDSIKKSGRRLFTATRKNTDNTNINRIKMGGKTMGISSDKQVESLTRKLGHG